VVDVHSDCCGASIDGIEGGEETGICPDCHEHCAFVSGEEDEKLPQCAGCMFEERGGSNCWHCTRNPIVKDNYWPNASVTGAAKPRTVDAVLDVSAGYVCTMDVSCTPEGCAQYRFGAKCANTGGNCPFRKTSNNAVRVAAEPRTLDGLVGDSE
jgi:hypothetical protein